MHDGSRGLVIWEDEGIRYDDVFPPRRREDNDLGNVIRRQGLAASIDSVSLGLVAVESNN